MVSNISVTLFVKNSEKYTSWLDKWLEGEIVLKRTNDDGGVFCVYQKDKIRFSVTGAQGDTNTPEKVGGSTGAVSLVMDSAEAVEALYKKAVEIGGMTSMKEPGELEGVGGSLAVLQDAEKQWWHFGYFPSA